MPSLLKYSQSEMVSVSGCLQFNIWADRDGNDRQQWQVLVDTLISVRTVRPGGRKPANSQQLPNDGQDGYRNRYRQPSRDLNDPIPF